jgi:hypothetical protein
MYVMRILTVQFSPDTYTSSLSDTYILITVLEPSNDVRPLTLDNKFHIHTKQQVKNIHFFLSMIFNNISTEAMLGGSLVTMAWHVLRLDETSSRYER